MILRNPEVYATFVVILEIVVSVVLLRVSATETPEFLQTIFGIVGNKAHLPCNISPPTADDSVALILWYKDEATTPLYSLDARRGSLNQARHAPSDVISSRAYLSISRRPAILQLDPLQEDDEGFYRCRVDFRKARTRNSDVILTVLVPPKKPIITDHSGEILQSLIGPYNEGDRLLLICEAEGGKPLPAVTWWRESVLLDDTYEVSPLGIVRNELELSSLQRHDLMAVYACQASNNNFSYPETTSVTVDMNFRPVEVEIAGEKRPLSAGSTVELLCKVVGSRPPAAVSWWLDKRQLKQSRESVSIDGYVTTSSLRFTPSREDHKSRIICRAHNTYIPASVIQASWQLEVYYSPHVSLRLGSKLQQSKIYEGNDIYLECNVISNPPVKDIQWQFDGSEVKHNDSNRIIITNHSLLIQRIQRRNKGIYKCLARNSEGQGESNEISLRVQFTPFCKQSQKIIYGAARHEAIQVTCEVQADPPDVQFRWEFNNSAENLEIVNFRSKGTTSVATYVLRTQYDYGTLLCWGRNEVGSQKEPCVYTVVPAGPPDAVDNCTITNQTEEAIGVECRAGYNGGLQQHFVLEIHDTILHRLILNITSDTPCFQVQDLPPDASLIVVVYAVNNKGKSQSYVLKTFTLSVRLAENEKDSWRFPFSPAIIILSCVVVGLAISALLIVVMVKHRADYYLKVRFAKRKKEKETQEDQFGVRQAVAEEKCPDIIPDKSFKTDEERLLEDKAVEMSLKISRDSDHITKDEEKIKYKFVQSPSKISEYPMESKYIKVSAKKVAADIQKLQTEV